MSGKTSFNVRIYSPRWAHEDTYKIKLSRDQLIFSGIGKEAKCTWVENRDPVWLGYKDKIGNALEKMLENDSIYPPTIFVRAIEHAWMAWRDGTLDSNQIASEVGELCEWLNVTAKAKPSTDFWRGIF